MNIDLTELELVNLTEFIETELIDVIRRDKDIDSYEWLESLVSANSKLKYALEKLTSISESEPKVK